MTSRVLPWHMAHSIWLDSAGLRLVSGLRCAIPMKTISVLAGALVLAGCGGGLANPIDGGSGDDGGNDSSPPGMDGGIKSGCPATPPTSNGACTPNGQRCEYGANPDPSCNQMFVCLNGSWVEQTPGTYCPPQADCPATYASVPVNQNCMPNNLACSYMQGTCFCTQGGGGPVKQYPQWSCVPATTTCPSPRPDIGTACSEPGQTCDYGACSGGVGLSCMNGSWQEVNWTCPL
jgi:hypothetical protein